jgi:exodeoxyribonuclease VII large subunit
MVEASHATAKPLSVTDAATLIRTAIQDTLPGRLSVTGEVSNFSDRTHWFFSIKDRGACLSCVMFASAAKAAGCRLEDGMQVVIDGRVDLYPAQGRLQLYVDRVRPVGRGELEAQLRERMATLREAGWFDPAGKRALPAMPRKVAVVTSRRAAALQDVIDTARRRMPGCRLVLVDVPVQGPGASPGVVAALDALSEHGPGRGIEAVIVTRGGGSLEDLWAFNELAVAEAVRRCELPVVAAIGHETDTTIAELVADVRCATPTQAAMTLLPDAGALLEQVDRASARLGAALRREARVRRQGLASLGRRLAVALPGRTAAARRRLDDAACRLPVAVRRRVQARRVELAAAAGRLEALSPRAVLERGFTYTTGGRGKLLRSAEDAKQQATLTTHFADGQVVSAVGAAKARRRRKRKGGSGGPSLFEGEAGSAHG